MTPRQYWIGWGLMAFGWLVSLIAVSAYLGAKLTAILEVLRER